MKRIITIIIVIVTLCTISGCSIISDYYQYFHMELQTLTRYYNESVPAFKKAASIFEKYPELDMVTTSKTWLNSPRDDYTVKECNSLIIITRTKVFSDAEYEEIAESVSLLFSQRQLSSIKKFKNTLHFTYISIFQGSNGWIYTPDRTEPDKKVHFISETEKITDNWYSVIWAN